MLAIELIVLFAILSVLGAACYAGRRIYTAVLNLVCDYSALLQTQRSTLTHIATTNTESFKSLCSAHSDAMTDVTNAHTALLTGVGQSHLSGASALANTCTILEQSTKTIAGACEHLNETAVQITRALGSSFMKDIADQLTAMRNFVVPRN